MLFSYVQKLSVCKIYFNVHSYFLKIVQGKSMSARRRWESDFHSFCLNELAIDKTDYGPQWLREMIYFDAREEFDPAHARLWENNEWIFRDTLEEERKSEGIWPVPTSSVVKMELIRLAFEQCL